MICIVFKILIIMNQKWPPAAILDLISYKMCMGYLFLIPYTFFEDFPYLTAHTQFYTNGLAISHICPDIELNRYKIARRRQKQTSAVNRQSCTVYQMAIFNLILCTIWHTLFYSNGLALAAILNKKTKKKLPLESQTPQDIYIPGFVVFFETKSSFSPIT